MRLTKTIIAVLFVSVIFSNAAGQAPLESQERKGEGQLTEPKKESLTGQAEPNDLAAHYGFDEMEIIKLDWRIKNLRIADFNGDGRNDIAIVNNRKAKIEFLVQKETVGPGETEVAVDPNDIDINVISPPTRFERQSVAVSQKVFSFVCGDLNSDGMMDLAFYGDPRGLYVILQKAGEEDTALQRERKTGTKVESKKLKTLRWRTRKKIKIDDGLVTPNALVCADLNNDGADDLALAGRDAIYVILQKEDGSLAEPVKYPTTSLTLGVDVGDLNGDNINDLILITNDSEKPIHVRFGLKTGQLGPQVQFFIEKPWAFELANMDGEAGDEILTVDGISKRLMCYKLAAEKERDADWPILLYPLISGEGNTRRDLVVGDFDGDGLVDVTISDPGAAELIFYKQTAGLGLVEPVRFPAFADTSDTGGLSVADIDSDGKAEVAILSVSEKVIGLSEFENDRLSFPQPIDLTGEPVAMELADVDHDGSIDCLYISKDANDIRALRVIYNLAEAVEAEANSPKKKEKQPKTTEEAGETGPALELKELTSNPDGLKVLDVDQDGLQDVLIFVKYDHPILVRQTKRKEFELIDSPKAQASLIKDASLHSIAVADADGQGGKELLVAQKNFARSLVFAGGESWSIIDQYNAKSTENNITAVAAFDIDGEGPGSRPAILLLDAQKGQLQILKAGDDKTYRFEKELNVGQLGAATHLKMLFTPLTGNETKNILLFDSEKFALITPLSPIRSKIPGMPVPLPAGTSNGASSSNIPQYLEQQFSYETKIKDGRYGTLVAGDINSDGRADIIMVEYKRNHIEILALDSETKPIPAMRFKIFEQKSYRDKKGVKSSIEPRELKVADVTGDGKDDLVTVIHDRIIIYPQD